jgi:outer membrane protein assembly factor BamB
MTKRPLSTRKLAQILFAVLLGWPGLPATAADWPTWRCDGRRSAASSEQLAEQLHLAWVRELPAARIAWPNEPRLAFDACYEPVVAGNTLLIGSPNYGSVTAFDTGTGAERWKFFTEGPVRFAPAILGGKCYVGSDDGWLYCLDLRDGKLLWKCRGAPNDRPDRRHLGNGRLVSFWPVRGGPVVSDGTVYFAAGIWPTMGVFVAAVDAESGRLVWRNGDLGFLEKVRLDHNELGSSGLSPQGYLAVEGDTLLVPNGRSMPAGLDRKTGKLLYYVQGYRNGDCRVAAVGKYVFVGKDGVVDRTTGREVGSRWAAAGREAPNRFEGNKVHQFEGPIHPYKSFAGCSAASVLTSEAAYDLVRGGFAAHDLAAAKLSEYDWNWMGRTLRPWRWEVPLSWTFPTGTDAIASIAGSLIKAGNRLYGHVGATVTALELPKDGTLAKIVWKHAVDGTPGTMLAADGRLFVVTREGRISCFGPAAGEPRRIAVSSVPLPTVEDAASQTAAKILEQTGVREGYCVLLGVGNGRLAGELLRRSDLRIIAVDRENAKVNRLRQQLIAAGLYGTRAEVSCSEPFRFLFPPYLASLAVCEDPAGTGFSMSMPAGPLFDLLRPYGGTMCVALLEDRQQEFEQWAAAAKLENCEVQRAGRFAVLRRAGPLSGAAAWTHESADAARSFFSHDGRVRPPLAVLWYGDGGDHGFWKEKDYGTGVKPQVIGGRVFALHVNGGMLSAYDVYTGRLLWKIKVPPFARYASMEDGVYVAGGKRCAILDSATGRERASFAFDPFPNRSCFVSDIRVADDVVLVAVASEKARAIEKGLWDASTLVALDRSSGRQLWERHASERFNNNSLAVGAGMVFCVDSLTPIETKDNKSRAAKGEPTPSNILALDARTGKMRWSKSVMHPYRTYTAESWLGLLGQDDWLAYCRGPGLVLAGKQQKIWAFEAAEGKDLWQKERAGNQPYILLGDTFLDQSGTMFDVRTGKPTGKRFALNRGGCNYVIASEHLALFRDQSASYIELATGRKHQLFAVRSGCSNSMIAADGILSVPCFSVGCICNYPVQTSFAMFPLPEAAAR